MSTLSVVKPDLTFNHAAIDALTADDMGNFFKAARENDNRGMAALFAKVVSKCPSEWGDPDKVSTYMNLPYFTGFKRVLNAFVEEVNGKN